MDILSWILGYKSGLKKGGGSSGGSGGGVAIAVVDKISASGGSDHRYIGKITIPADATGFYYWHSSATIKVADSKWATLGTTTIPEGALNPTDIVATDLGNGYKSITVIDETITGFSNGALYLTDAIDSTKAMYMFTMPNVTIENNILYAGADCLGLFPQIGSVVSARKTPLYLEGVDLRGSQVQELLPLALSGYKELKKIWLSEVMNKLGGYFLSACTGLEEIHFTSTTPPKAVNGNTFSDIPTTCKIYVPAGTLSAYTSASNYPSSSTYTYVEE